LKSLLAHTIKKIVQKSGDTIPILLHSMAYAIGVRHVAGYDAGMAQSAPLLAFARKQGGSCSVPYQLINQFTN